MPEPVGLSWFILHVLRFLRDILYVGIFTDAQNKLGTYPEADVIVHVYCDISLTHVYAV